MPSRPLPPPPSPQPHTPSHYRTLLISLTISFSSILLLSILFLLLYLYFSLLHRSSPTLPFPTTAARPQPAASLRRFSHRQLRLATNGFRPSNSLGRGGSASVFRGVLPGGKSVAVKVLDRGGAVPDHSFANELKILGGLPPFSSPFVVSLLGYCSERRKRMLVFEYLPNRSLQELLFGSSEESPREIDWGRRFGVILDVAQAITFLHLECDPPVIHGDIKPSNVLLGDDFRAKISDFGLSRLKNEENLDLGMDEFSQDLLGRSQELDSSSQVDFLAALRGTCSSYSPMKNSNGGASPKGKQMVGDDEVFSIEHSKELVESNGVCSTSPVEEMGQPGNGWWWKQDGSGELCSKDYVSEWIGSQIRPVSNPDWDVDGVDQKSSPNKLECEHPSEVQKFEGENETRVSNMCADACSEKKNKEGVFDADGCGVNKNKKMREWWKEEYFVEISKKGKCSKRFKWLRPTSASANLSSDEVVVTASNCNKNSDSSTDFSFRKAWKRSKKRTCSVGSDMFSGDLFSRELGSATSMRGTVCYVAPESGGLGGHLMEKADIYSFGVLVLVVVSGRRPLHVMSSPMKLEKANLISWCRSLAQNGNILELVDEKLNDSYNREQAALCINLALLCLQRSPELRPDSGEIVKILKGEVELPAIPIEFSPSPPSKPSRRHRKKFKSESVL